jgi:hypothetical protein
MAQDALKPAKDALIIINQQKGLGFYHVHLVMGTTTCHVLRGGIDGWPRECIRSA